MPISIQLSKGLLTSKGEQEVFSRVAKVLLQVHGIEGNKFMTTSVVGHVHIHPEENCYAALISQSLAVIEVKVPSITFPAQEIKDKFVFLVTEIIEELKAGAHPKDRTFVNVTYAVEGTWGIAGKAYSNTALGEAIAAAA
jgi:phenylpyruvate tautomerase PptA (4-oxalocrotonate tautomerase family)